MSREERLKLLMEIKKKELKLSHLSEQLGVSTSLLSQYFKSKCNMSHDKEIKLKSLVNQSKEFRWCKVYID